MLLGLQIYFFFLTLQKWRKIKDRNTSRGKQATFKILAKGLSSCRRGLFFWIWRKGPIPSFQMKYCPWFHPSVKWKLFLWSGSPAMWLVVCCRKQRVKVLQGCGVETQRFIEDPVRREPFTSITLFLPCWKHKYNLLTPQPSQGKQVPLKRHLLPKERSLLETLD